MQNSDLTVPNEGGGVTLQEFKPAFHYSFFNEGQREVGKLSFDDSGALTFEGDVDEAAQVFFDQVIKKHSTEILRLEGELDAAKE